MCAPCCSLQLCCPAEERRCRCEPGLLDSAGTTVAWHPVTHISKRQVREQRRRSPLAQ